MTKKQKDLEQSREIVKRWRRVGPLLAKIKRAELRRFDHTKEPDSLDDLLRIATPRFQTNTKCGLVELQRLLHKAQR